MQTIMEHNPEASQRMSELASAAEMGLQLEYSKSPAFIGLLIADVKSAELPGYSAPQVRVGRQASVGIVISLCPTSSR
jgi:hypothetical protein